MKLSVMQMMLLIDTLKGSLEIVNGTGRNFNFSNKDRENLLNYIVKQMNDAHFDISLDSDNGYI